MGANDSHWPGGDFYVADVPYGRVFRVSPEFANWTEALRDNGEPHGLAFEPDGHLVIADYKTGIQLCTAGKSCHNDSSRRLR
jgi:sugar lactone lactonase YvrE